MFRRVMVYVAVAILALPAALWAQSGRALPDGRATRAQAVAPDTRCALDVEYVSAGGKAQSGAKAALPVVAFIHGGGWSGGDKASCPTLPLLGRGYVAVSINYRLTGKAPWPAQIYDCKAAIRYLRAHAAEYQIDPERIGVWGSSAGGHLVAMLGLTGGVKELEGNEGGPENLAQSSKVQAVCDWFGPTDIIALVNQATGTHLTADGGGVTDDAKAALAKAPRGNLIRGLLGGPIWEHLDAARQASPMTYVAKDAAPLLIMQGTADPLVPAEQSKMLDAALQKAGAASSLVLLDHAGHGGPAFDRPEVLQQVAAFFDRHLKK